MMSYMKEQSASQANQMTNLMASRKSSRSPMGYTKEEFDTDDRSVK